MSSKHLITHLRHVDIAMPELGGTLPFYRDLWGLTETESDGGIHFLAAEGSPEQYIVRLRQDPMKRLDLVAFGAASPADVDTLAEQLAKSGIAFVREPAMLDTPGGGYGTRFFDIDGRVVEVSADVCTGRTVCSNRESLCPCVSRTSSRTRPLRKRPSTGISSTLVSAYRTYYSFRAVESSCGSCDAIHCITALRSRAGRTSLCITSLSRCGG